MMKPLTDEEEARANRALLGLSLMLLLGACAVGWRAEKFPLAARSHMPGGVPVALLLGSLAVAVPVAMLPLRCPHLLRSDVFGLRVFMCLFLLASPLALLLMQAGLLANGALSTGGPRTFQTTVMERNRIASKGSVSYFLVLDDWLVPGSTVRVRVLPEHFASAPLGMRASIATRRGFLGWEWIVRHDLM